jgi:hypothetical protein
VKCRWEERIWIYGRACRQEQMGDRTREKSRIMSPVDAMTLALDTLLRALITPRVRELNGGTRDREQEREEEASSWSVRRVTAIKSPLAPSSRTAADYAS